MDIITKHPRTRLSPEKRKQQLLEIGIEVFAKRGIGRGGHADIAEIAQVSVATVFNYFPTREELVDEILRQVEHRYSEFIRQHTDASQPIKTNLIVISHQLIDTILADTQWIKVWFEWSTSTRADVWSLFVATHVQHQSYFRGLFSCAIETGEIDSQYEPGDMAKIFYGICYSLFVQANHRHDRNYLIQLANSFLDMLSIYKN